MKSRKSGTKCCSHYRCDGAETDIHLLTFQKRCVFMNKLEAKCMNLCMGGVPPPAIGANEGQLRPVAREGLQEGLQEGSRVCLAPSHPVSIGWTPVAR